MSNIDLLPRADLPVIWDAFKAQAEPVRQIAETLTVTDISQKEEMALARKTRLTLREIRIAVEHKRVELGEGHLKEIQKVNGAAKAIREFIEPLEARLLVQESYAERFEERRIAQLTICRNAELESVRVGASASNTGNLSQADYDEYIARLRAEKAELEEANRARIEAEKRLEEQRVEANAILNAKLEQQRKEAEALEIQRTAEHKAEREEWERQNVEAERVRLEQEAKLRNERSVAEALRVLEREKTAKEAAARKEIEDRAAAERQEAEEKYRREQAEKDRIRDEQLAVLEAELAQANAAKQAEADAARKLALAPDAAKLIAYVDAVRSAPIPVLHSKEATIIFNKVALAIASACGELRLFCN